MPKTDTPATRRSARVAAKSSGPAASQPAVAKKVEAKKPKSKAAPVEADGEADAKVTKEVTETKETKEPKSKEPKSKETKPKEPKSKETKPKEPISKETKPKEPKSKEPKSKEPKSKEATTKEPKSKEATTKEPKSKDAKPKSAVKSDGATEAAGAKPAPASKGPLKLGQVLPSITVEDNTGAEVDVSTLAGEKGVVIFLYPRADTPGCTKQACGYRDIHSEIADLGYDVYGLSRDKPAAQQKWINKKDLNYKLLCDPESTLIKKLGAFVEPKNTKRSHFIFEKGTGKLVDIALGVKPVDDPGNVLKFLKTHHA